jgi:hypothetical protein
VSSLNDPRPHLCAILRGELTHLPLGDARDRLLAVARAHRVDRLVAWLTGQIDDEHRAAAILDEVEVRELNRVLAALETHGVEPLVLKGAALAHTHYRESWLRPRLDADLLIPDSQRQLVTDVLHDLGFVRPLLISGELVMYQMAFARLGAIGEMHLDVHWRVANPQALAEMPKYEELASRACTVSVRGQSVRTPCPVDALSLACVHRAAHHGLSDDLIWLYDIHLLAERFSAIEWTDFVALATRKHVRSLCSNGLQAAQECFHTPIPREVISRLTDFAQGTEQSALYLRKDLTRVDRLRADLSALGLRARLRLLFEHLIPPAGYISEKYGVRHRSLLPLFYLRRVVEGFGHWPRAR